jgi:hypothetical protein
MASTITSERVPPWDDDDLSARPTAWPFRRQIWAVGARS